MIDSLILENFRCWRGRHEIPLRPLTLIYGENSSGKSSLFHALQLLRQTLEDAYGDRVALRCSGAHIRLGDFRNLVSDHDERLPLQLGFTYRGDSQHPALRGLGARRGVALEFVHDRRVAGGGALCRIELSLGPRSVTFVTDAVGFLAFLGLATLVLSDAP